MKTTHEKLSLLVSAPVVSLAAVVILSLFTDTARLSSIPAVLVGLVFHAGFSSAPALIDYWKQKMPDFEFPEKKKRRKYYALAAFGDGVGFILYFSAGAQALSALALTYFISASLVGLINERWKISAHAAGLAGPLVIGLWAFGWWAVPLFSLIPLVFWLRIKTHAHDFNQLAGGAALAAGCSILALAALRLL